MHVSKLHILTYDSILVFYIFQLNAIQQHTMQLHFQLRPYKCKYCDMSNAMKHIVKRHLAEIHPGQPSKVITDQQQVSKIREERISMVFLACTNPAFNWNLNCVRILSGVINGYGSLKQMAQYSLSDLLTKRTGLNIYLTLCGDIDNENTVVYCKISENTQIYFTCITHVFEDCTVDQWVGMFIQIIPGD